MPFALLPAIGELSEAELRRGLGHLQGAEFLYETSLFPELEYTFKHALTHEVAYGSLLLERRRGLHATIVSAIERLYADRLTEQVERLAQHAFRGEVWPGPGRWRVRPCERPGRASSRPWQLSRISRRAAPRRSRPSTSGSACGMRSWNSEK